MSRKITAQTSLAGWRNRLLPKTSHAAWRGILPRLRDLNVGVSSLSLRRACFFAKVSARQVIQPILAIPVESRWLVWLPCKDNIGFFSSQLNECGGSLSATPYIDTLWQTVFRGLGGLCRLKLRYKGKSFKWHRRHGCLLLRFGHAHLVALKPQKHVRWRKFGRMKIIIFGSNWWDLLAFAQAACFWRTMNVYHGRGIRLRRQFVLRKAGKVSAYR